MLQDKTNVADLFSKGEGECIVYKPLEIKKAEANYDPPPVWWK
jgi:hypothetical protein